MKLSPDEVGGPILNIKQSWSFYIFLVVRILPIIATGFYVFITPEHQLPEKTPLYTLLTVFFVFSFVLWYLFSAFSENFNKLMYLVFAGDLLFITLLVRFTGGFESEFFLAYLLLVAVEALYFGFRFGLAAGVLSVLCYIIGNFDMIGDIYWMHLGLRAIFIMSVAALVGVFSEREREREEIVRLNEANKNKIRELTTLYEIGRSIQSTLELDKLLYAILDMVSVAIHLESAAILLTVADDKPEGEVRFDHTVSRNFSDDLKGFLAESEGVKSVVREREPILVSDMAQDKRFAPLIEKEAEAASFVVVPLISKGNAIGVLCATDFRKGAFAEDAMKLLTTVAGQISIAIENSRLYEETKRLSITDGLTGLHLRRSFQQILNGEIERAKRFKNTVSLLIMDVDHFKAHNDEFGHPSGDEVLKVVARIIKESCRSVDTAARFGGEEFTAILINTDLNGAEMIAERIRRRVEGQEFRGNEATPVVHKTISIGIADYPDSATDKSELIEKADEALYRAKKEGRNCIIRYR